MQRRQTVRFWAFVNGGWVRLTLKAGQTLRWFRGGPTEEGWFSEGETWTYEPCRHCGHAVVNVRDTDGSDCDGRLSTHAERRFSLGQENAVEPYHEGGEWFPMVPKWEHGARSQRDYAAEAMGY